MNRDDIALVSAAIACTHCLTLTWTTRYYNEHSGATVNSEGGMFFDEGFVCDRCLENELHDHDGS